MDKVIIDGIDVSECEHLNACDKKMKCVILQDDVCEIDPYCKGYDCYYKQLKRLQQENNELKKEILNQAGQILTLSADKEKVKWQKEDINKLQAENDKLKLENSDLDNQRHIAFEMTDNCNKRLQNYKQALQEIRDMLKEIIIILWLKKILIEQ